MVEPVYLDPVQTTEAAIRARLFAAVVLNISKRQGGFLWDALNPDAQELAMAADLPAIVLQRGFLDTADAAWLDRHSIMVGTERGGATKAVGAVRFSGANGTVIGAGTRVGTPTIGTVPAVTFTTDANVTIAGGIADVPITAEVAGIAGNVAIGSISVLLSAVVGVTSITNLAATSGGADAEANATFRARMIGLRAAPPSSSNKAALIKWAQDAGNTPLGLAAGGVGGVSVLMGSDAGSGGANHALVAIVNASKQPASQALIDVVQNYISPPIANTRQAETMTRTGAGTSVVGGNVVMAPNAAAGTLVERVFDNTLDYLKGPLQLAGQPGNWQARIRLNVSSIAGVANLLDVGIYNVSQANWEKSTVLGALGGAHVIKKASELWVGMADLVIPFGWTGTDYLELRLTRLAAELVTTVNVDSVTYRSTFGNDAGDGLVSGGIQVTVASATPLTINYSATIQPAPGYTVAGLAPTIAANIDAYLKSLVFTSNNDVAWSGIGNAIQDTPGVLSYTTLLVNGGVANIPVGALEVAVIGVGTLV